MPFTVQATFLLRLTASNSKYLLQVYHESTVYNDRNLVELRTLSVKGSVSEVSYSYDNAGSLAAVDTNDVKWRFARDGARETVDFGFGQSRFDLEFGERIAAVNDKFPVDYDERGNQVSRHNFSFQFNGLGQLTAVEDKEGLKASFLFDELDRVMVHKEDSGETVEYFYAIREKPFLVTQARHSSRGVFGFYYDERDHLFAVKHRNEMFYVICDKAGTPEIVFNSTGGVEVSSF